MKGEGRKEEGGMQKAQRERGKVKNEKPAKDERHAI